jgi:7-keto-8-aminopelargonate synthetase-like enzyme
MQTLVFNTTDKTVKFYRDVKQEGQILAQYINVPTVKVQEGYYEVMLRTEEMQSPIPVLRVPVSNTNMFIEK